MTYIDTAVLHAWLGERIEEANAAGTFDASFAYGTVDGWLRRRASEQLRRRWRDFDPSAALARGDVAVTVLELQAWLLDRPDHELTPARSAIYEALAADLDQFSARGDVGYREVFPFENTTTTATWRSKIGAVLARLTSARRRRRPS